MIQFSKGDIIRFRYTHDMGDRLRQGDAASAAYAVRREASIGGLGAIVNPKPVGRDVFEVAIRLDRDATLVDIIRAIPTGTFTDSHWTFTDPDGSYTESGTLNGDEEWREVDVTFEFKGFEV